MENNNEIDINNSKIVEKDSQNLAEKFAQSVVRKNVFAKLPRGAKINGVEIDWRTSGYWNYGPNKIESFNGTFNWLQGNIQDSQDELPELVNSHMLCINRTVNNEKNKIISINFFQDDKVDRRAYSTTQIQYEFPKEEAIRFIEEVSKNPDLLEEFYQTTFVELDSTNEHPGIRRVKADGFYLITESYIQEIVKMEYSLSSSRKNKIKEFFNNLKKYHYKNGPYGSGNPFKPRF